jgi:prephenate dehydratase
VNGHCNSSGFAKALEELKDVTVYMKVLGSYSKGDNPLDYKK